MSGFGISGLGSGIDFSLYIDAIVQADEQRIARTLGVQQFEAEATRTAFINVQQQLNSLSSAIKSFTFTGDFKRKVVSSSDETVVSGSATLSALDQSVAVTVNSLASSEKATISEFDSVDDVVHNGSDTTITIKVRGEDYDIEVPSGTTLSELGDLINAANIGVTANVFDTGGADPSARLALTDNKIGIWDGGTGDYGGANDYTNIEFVTFIDTDGGLDQVTTSPTAVDATNTEVEIGGETIYTDSLTISGVLPGVTLTVKDIGDATIGVTEDISNAASQIEGLVETYNATVGLLRQAIRFDPNAETQTNPTAGNSTLRNILTRLQNSFNSTILTLPDSNDAIRSLTDLGVTTNFDTENSGANGTLSFDSSVFNAALEENFEQVTTFFSGIRTGGVESKGFADTLDEVMDSFLDSVDGAVPSKIKSLDATLKRISDDQQDKLRALSEKEQTLVQKFARLESQLAGLNAQQSSLSAAINSINLNSQFIANSGSR